MIVKRTIVPVGIGAFCIERFTDESTDEVLFLTIYDCGKGRLKGASKRLMKIIDEELDSNHKSVDFLFLSHFDNDHINGLSYLIERKYVNEGTKVFLPLIPHVSEIDLYDYINNLHFKDIIKRLHSESIQMAFVRHVGHNDENGRQVEDNDNLIGNNNTKSQDNIWDIISSYPVIDSFNEVLTTRKVEGFWKYVPFYLHDNGIFEEFKEYVLDSNPYRVTYNDFFCFKDWTEEKKEWLKRTYQNYKYRKSKYSGEVSPINMNAMMLISDKAEPTILTRVRISKAHLFDATIGSSTSIDNVLNCSAVYTSDVGLQKHQYFEHVKKAVNINVISSFVGLFQIPHHGSPHCYNRRIFTEIPFEISFCNCKHGSINPKYSTLYEDDAMNSCRPFVIVDGNPAHRFEEVIQVSV